MRITVFGGSLPSDPSGKVNFMNEFGVVTLVAAWPETAGEGAARYRLKGNTQLKMANRRFMDMCSQLTQDCRYHARAVRRRQARIPLWPAEGLPGPKGGIFTQDLYDEAKKDGWIAISMRTTGSAFRV
jgi:hypothetical protein